MRLSATRPGQESFRGLASTACVLLLAGLSCKYNVTLPWVPEDASARRPEDATPRVLDSAFDQAPSPALDLMPPDLPLASPDARGCGNKTYPSIAGPIGVQIIVALDRSTSMQAQQRDFEPSKTQAAWQALNYAGHPGINFATVWYPWNNCGGPACCSSQAFEWRRMGTPDASGNCGPYESACGPSTNESPTHQALEKASSYLNGTWNRGYSSTLILISDQKPSCAGDSPSDTTACENAVRQARGLVEDGIRIYVVVPNADNRVPECLARIAKQNTHDLDAQQPIVVRDSTSLQKQIEAIISENEKRLCLFWVRDFTASQIQEIRIGDNPPIQYDGTGATGWRVSGNAIELSPAECNRALTSKVTPYGCASGGGPGPSYGN